MPERVYTHRERFRRLMHFQSVDRGIHWEFGYLAETVQRFHQEGLPAQYNDDGAIERYFGRDPVTGVPTHMSIHPGFTEEILEETDNTITKRLASGEIAEVQKSTQSTIPHYLKFPIENRRDWEEFKDRLNPDDPVRHQHDYKAMIERCRNSDVPVGIGCGSYLGWIRNWVGFENLAFMVVDDPGLVEEMVEHLVELFLRVLEPALKEIELDFAAGWEDICFNTGSVIGPKHYREIVLPHQTRVMRLLRQHGVDVIYTDCDGNVHELLPLWLECGMNGMFPCEVKGGSDPVELRALYGKEVLLFGGVGKMELAKGKEEILAELKRLAPLVEEGGFIPMVDHRCPEYVSYENYRYYQREKLAMLGFSAEEVAEIEPLKGMAATMQSAVR